MNLPNFIFASCSKFLNYFLKKYSVTEEESVVVQEFTGQEREVRPGEKGYTERRVQAEEQGAGHPSPPLAGAGTSGARRIQCLGASYRPLG